MAVSEKATAEEAEVAIICSFCQKPTTDVEAMVAGPGVFICNECVNLCVEIIASKPAVTPKAPRWQEQQSDEDLLATLPKIAAAGRQLEQQLADYVTQARFRGITWTRIGTALGMTRQSAWERFSGEE